MTQEFFRNLLGHSIPRNTACERVMTSLVTPPARSLNHSRFRR